MSERINTVSYDPETLRTILGRVYELVQEADEPVLVTGFDETTGVLLPTLDEEGSIPPVICEDPRFHGKQVPFKTRWGQNGDCALVPESVTETTGVVAEILLSGPNLEEGSLEVFSSIYFFNDGRVVEYTGGNKRHYDSKLPLIVEPIDQAQLTALMVILDQAEVDDSILAVQMVPADAVKR